MMSRRGRIRWISYAVALALVLGVALAACHVGAGGYTTRIDAQSTRAFGEALSAVERLDRSLQKCAFASGSAMESTVCAQIYSDAQSAQTALSTLPVELDALEAISRHISTVGDYAFALSRAAAEGQSFSSEELERLSDFEKTTDTLYEQLSQLRQDYQDGAVISEYLTVSRIRWIIWLRRRRARPIRSTAPCMSWLAPSRIPFRLCMTELIPIIVPTSQRS